MNRMTRMTIGLLGAGLLLGATAARAEEKPAAAAGTEEAAAAANLERLLALPWPDLREPLGRPPWKHLPKKDREAFAQRMVRPLGDLYKRQFEIYKQINEGKIDEAFPTVWDV